MGSMPDAHVGSALSLGGEWKPDAKYGRRFSVATCAETLPATVVGIEKYLGSGLVRGIGSKFAQRIVQRFGQDTFDVIEETPEKLTEVPGRRFRANAPESFAVANDTVKRLPCR